MDTTHFREFFLRFLKFLLHLKFPSNSQEFTTPQTAFNHHERSENLPFSRNLVRAERKRMQIIWLESIWFRATQHIALSWGSWGCRIVTLMPHPLKCSPQASLGAFPFAVWKNWRGGIHDPLQRKEHSKTEFEKRKLKATKDTVVLVITFWKAHVQVRQGQDKPQQGSLLSKQLC